MIYDFDLRREFAKLIADLTSNLVGKTILTPIRIENSIEKQVAITIDGIKKWKYKTKKWKPYSKSSEIYIENMELDDYQAINWTELVDWVKNNTEIDPNLFYQIGESIAKYNQIPKVESYHIRKEEEVLYNTYMELTKKL